MSDFAGGSGTENEWEGGSDESQDQAMAAAARSPYRQKMRCFLVVASLTACWYELCKDDEGVHVDQDHVTVVGAVLAEAFKVTPVGGELEKDAEDMCRCFALKQVSADVFGWVTYPIVAFACLQDPVSFMAGTQLHTMLAALEDKPVLHGRPGGGTSGSWLGTVMTAWQAAPHMAKPPVAAQLPPWIATSVARGTPRGTPK